MTTATATTTPATAPAESYADIPLDPGFISVPPTPGHTVADAMRRRATDQQAILRLVIEGQAAGAIRQDVAGELLDKLQQHFLDTEVMLLTISGETTTEIWESGPCQQP